MKCGPLRALDSPSGGLPPETVDARRVVRTYCLLLVAAWVLAGAARTFAATDPGHPAARLSPEASSPAPLSESAETQTWGTVRAVLDGTSLVVITPELGRYDVRLLGVDPPEIPRPGRAGVQPTEGQPFGPEAFSYLRDLLTNKQVRLETYGKDRSGRTLGVVWLGDINVNLTLVKEGLAWVSPRIPVTKVRVELEVAERQARVGKYGLWALPDPEPPWEYRQRHRLPPE